MPTRAIIGRYTSAVVIALFVALTLSYVPARGASTTVVINEFRSNGPGLSGTGDSDDEFIELRNLSGSVIDLSGWHIEVSNASGSATVLTTLPVGAVIKPGCYYLIISYKDNYSLGHIDQGDWAYGTANRIPDNGGIGLFNPSNTQVDAAGMSGSPNFYFEGTPLSPVAPSGTQWSYTRASLIDGDNNAGDFSYTTSPTPTNYDINCTTGRAIR